MPSILNGLFSGRSGLTAHGIAMAVVGDNIANVSTVGYKDSRAEFEDLLAGGQTAGKVVGSGSSIAATTQNMSQGTLEFTGRPLDLAIDGNGMFAVEDNGLRYYTRAGNFKTSDSGYIVTQNDMEVLGFPANGSGTLEPINVNTISQSGVQTANIEIAGNVDSQADEILLATIPDVSYPGEAPRTATTYAQLNALAEFSSVVETFDTLGAKHNVTFFFFHTGSNQYTVRGYVNSEEVDTAGSDVGLPRIATEAVVTSDTVTMTFDTDGTRSNTPAAGTNDIDVIVPWNNGSDGTQSIGVRFDPFTQYASDSAIQRVTQDGDGVGSVTNVSIEKNGDIYGLLSNGQRALIGTLGLVNFPNPAGLSRIGNQLYIQSQESGAPVAGTPDSGTFGGIQAGATELSTVDIANEFVRLITLQRGFQANSRIISTVNQSLNEIIQLAG